MTTKINIGSVTKSSVGFRLRLLIHIFFRHSSLVCTMQCQLLLTCWMLALGSAWAQSFTHPLASKQNKTAWKRQMPQILKRIQAPLFPDVIVTVSSNSRFRHQVQLYIDSLSNIGGGKIIVAAGEYHCDGPIHLKSNINLHFAKGAVVKFSTNPKYYLPVVKVRWEGTVCYNYSPLLYAYRQKNIALSGEGILDGQASLFWHAWKKQPDGNDQEKNKKKLRDMGRDGVAEVKRIFGEGYKLRPTLIEFYECENILIEGLTLQQSPFWTVHPVFSKNITIRNITINKGTTNDDGIDPDGCQDVLIENCVIDTDDDPIAIKAGRDNDAWNRMHTQNIVIRNIKGRSRVGNGFCIGSEMSGGVENVFVENYYVSRADNGINIKSNLDRGGFVRNIYIRNVVIDSAVKTGILMQKDYHSYRGGNFPPNYQHIFMKDVLINFVKRKGMRIAGVPLTNISKVWLKNVAVKQQGEVNEIIHVEDLVEVN